MMTEVEFERIRNLIQNFDDFIACQCSECQSDARSHAIDTGATLQKLVDYFHRNLVELTFPLARCVECQKTEAEVTFSKLCTYLCSRCLNENGVDDGR